MKKSLVYLLYFLTFASVGFTAEPNQETLKNWHHWRGPLATGEAPLGSPPLQWSSDQNIAWKIELPGRGTSTPIIWGDKLFVLTSINTGRVDPSLPKPQDQPKRPFGITFPNTTYELVVICLDRNSGKELWRKTATEKIPHEGHHKDNDFASASPTTDGQRLYCWFGSQGLFCYDLNGSLLWKKDLGPVNTRRSFGEGCSPVIHDGRLIINRDQEGQSYIVVLDAADGSETWRQNRDELSTWNTPLVVEAAGKTQVIVNATNRARSYDLENGDLIWECGGQVTNVIPCVVSDGKNAICMSGYRGSIAVAIPLDATGDITGSDKISWSRHQGTPYVPSPTLVNGLLYFTQSNNAILSCVDSAAGEVFIQRTRMPGLRAIYSSPVAANDHLYFTGRDGTTLVIKQGKQFEVVSTNRLNDSIDTSPAIVGDSLYLRGKRSLYCIRDSK